MLNCCVFMGRLTADPELRTTESGLSVTTFSIAVDRDYAKNGEERQTDFINIVAWRQSADFVTRYFRKGSMICVQGSLQSRNYEDKNGNKRTAFEVVADRINFCGSKSESSNASYTGSNAPAPAPAAYSNTTADDFQTVVDDDLPF